MADLRASLGEDAIIVSTQTLDDGQVRVTGAVAEETFDLAEVLVPMGQPSSLQWLDDLSRFHEWPFDLGQDLRSTLIDMRPADPETLLATLLRAQCRFGRLVSDERRHLLFSGPPGAGTTTTCVKIAAELVLEGKSVDVLTLDVERVGALDRLKALLAPLDLTPVSVSASAEISNVLSACTADRVLLEGPSVNPFLPADLGRLSTLAAQSGAQLIPVVPAMLGYGDAFEIARSYLALNARSIVVTKLDAARRLGGLMAVAEAGLVVADVGIGPSIGEGLCELTPDGLARLLLRRYQNAVVEEGRR